MRRRNEVDEWSDEAQSVCPSIEMADPIRDREWKKRDVTKMLNHEVHYQAKGVGDGTTGTVDAERIVHEH